MVEEVLAEAFQVVGMKFACILTQFAFGRKMLYLCNSGAGLSMGKSRFFSVFEPYSDRFPSCFS